MTERIIFMDILSTKKTHIIATDLTTIGLNCHSKKGKDCYILNTFLLVIMLPLVIFIVCYYFAK